MPNPPKLPLTINQKATSYFDFLISSVSETFREYGMELRFDGYEKTIDEYSELKHNDFEKAWKLAQELNAWSEYISSIRSNARKMLQDAETEKLSVIASASILADNAKVANGDRLANKDEKVIAIRRHRNAIEAFVEELDAKISFLERAHYFCKTTCDWQQKALQSSK